MDSHQQEESPEFSRRFFKEILGVSGRVMRLIWGDKKGLIVLLAFVYVLVSLLPFARTGAFGLLLNELVAFTGSDAGAPRLTLLIAAVVALAALSPLLLTFQTYISKLVWFFVQEKAELLVMERRSELDVAAHEDPRLNDLLNRVDESGVWRLMNFTDRQFYFLQNGVEVAVASAILGLANGWVLALVFLGTLPELVIGIRYGSDVWGIHTARAEIRRKFWNLRSHFFFLPPLVELKLFQTSRHFLSIIRELFLAFQNEQKRVDRIHLIRQFVGTALSQAAIAGATLWFISEVIRRNLQIGTFTFLLASIAQFNTSLSAFFTNLGKQYQDGLFVTDVFRLVDLPAALVRPERGIRLDSARTPEIVFENVSFAYPGTERTVLNNISLAIHPGQKLALVGLNGSGKTTLVKLLCRFYDPTSGRILIGGNDLCEIHLDDWYAMLGVLFQDYANYHFLVRDAIAVGRIGGMPLLERVKEAAQASEADVFIEEWERKYEQMLGKQFTGGIEPSIGQWQKLALARTFYRDPRVLILDEPTASIDAESEAKIFEKIEALPKDRSVILISHRFSTVRHADRIAVIENGGITELGSHEELLGRDRTYARLFRLQAKGYA